MLCLSCYCSDASQWHPRQEKLDVVGLVNPKMPPAWLPMLPPAPPPSAAFWNIRNVKDCIRELLETLQIARAMQKELGILRIVNDENHSVKSAADGSADPSVSTFLKILDDRGIDLQDQEVVSVEAASALMAKLTSQLEPFRYVVDESSPWEEKSARVMLVNKVKKSKKNLSWRKRKRKRIAEMVAKERDQFDQVDQEADEWRVREIAKDIATQRVQKLKEIAMLKAKQEKKRLETELELFLVVEKLQELRSIRIQKLKKQGHFLPEEDDKFLHRVRAAVEEEERQAVAAADTDSAKDAIASAEESRKNLKNEKLIINDQSVGDKSSKEQATVTEDENATVTEVLSGSHENLSKEQSYFGAQESLRNLPIEFYHYYHGSSADMGTLIEVRRTWDTYIRPGGSRIPGHWVQPPPPTDKIWASYLVRPQVKMSFL